MATKTGTLEQLTTVAPNKKAKTTENTEMTKIIASTMKFATFKVFKFCRTEEDIPHMMSSLFEDVNVNKTFASATEKQAALTAFTHAWGELASKTTNDRRGAIAQALKTAIEVHQNNLLVRTFFLVLRGRLTPRLPPMNQQFCFGPTHCCLLEPDAGMILTTK